MTIDQAVNLLESEDNGTLPVREKELFYNEQDENSFDRFIYAFSTLTQKGNYLEKLIAKKAIDKIWFLKSYSGKGTLRNPYVVETTFGDGLIYDAHEFFNHKKYPKKFEKYYSFANSYYFMSYNKKLDLDISVLTGVAEYGNPFMFCGILYNKENEKYVFDFDRDIVIDYDLFCKIYRFNEICRVSKSTLENDGVLDFKFISGKNLYLLFTAYDDAIDKIKEQPDISIIK